MSRSSSGNSTRTGLLDISPLESKTTVSTLDVFFSKLQKEDRVLLGIDIQSRQNLIFSKYDIVVLADGKEKTIMKNGSKFSGTLRLSKGKHVLKFCSKDNSEVSGIIDIDLNEHSMLSCTINSHRNEITTTVNSFKSFFENKDDSYLNKLYRRMRFHFDTALYYKKHLGKSNYRHYTVLYSEDTGEAVLLSQWESVNGLQKSGVLFIGTIRKDPNSRNHYFVYHSGDIEQLSGFKIIDIQKACNDSVK